MHHGITWQPSEDFPAFEGQSVDVWLALVGGKIIPGRFTENLGAPAASQAFMWFDTDQNLLDPADVQYWCLRELGEASPEPPQ